METSSFRMARRLAALLLLAAAACGGSGDSDNTGGSSQDSRATPAETSAPAGAEVTATVKVPGKPTGVTYGAGAVWVASSNGVTRIDPSTNEAVATIPYPDGFKATAPFDPLPPFARIDADDDGVWVALGAHRDIPVVRIDPKTNKVAATVTIEDAGDISRISVGETAVWVTSLNASTVTKIDPKTNEIVATIDTVKKPGAAASPSGVAEAFGSLWVENHEEGVLLRIDPKSGEVLERTRTDATGEIATDDTSVWVVGAGSTAVDRVDPKSGKITPIEGCELTTSADAGDGSLWVTEEYSICRVDGETNEGTRIFSDNRRLWFIVFAEDSWWVTVPDYNQVLRFEWNG